MYRYLIHSLLLMFSFLFLSCGNDSDVLKDMKLFPVQVEAGFQFIDKDGKVIINPQFSEVSVFRNGLALIRNSDGKFGFIDEDGKIVIQPKYIQATTFSDGLAWVVQENGAPSAINEDGNTVFTLKNAKVVYKFREGFAGFVVENVKFGFVNTEGEVVINPQFSNINSFSEGKAGVADNNNKWGYINKDGQIVINYQFEEVKKFNNGIAAVKSNGKWGLIDVDGKYIVNPQFDYINEDGEIYIISQSGKLGWCNKDGEILINPQFDDALGFRSNNLAPVKSGDKWGYIDKEGKIQINPQFSCAFPFIDDLAFVDAGNGYGLINKDGKYVINPQYSNFAYDLRMELFFNYSTYSTAESDFFDVQPIISELKKVVGSIKPAGFKEKAKEFQSKYSNEINNLQMYNYNIRQYLALSKFNYSDAYLMQHGVYYHQKDFSNIEAFGFEISNSSGYENKFIFIHNEILQNINNYSGYQKVKELSEEENLSEQYYTNSNYKALQIDVFSNKETKVEVFFLHNYYSKKSVILILYSIDNGNSNSKLSNSSEETSGQETDKTPISCLYNIGDTNFTFYFQDSKVKYAKGSGFIAVESSGTDKFLYYEKDNSGKVIGTYHFDSGFLSGEYRRAKDNKVFKFAIPEEEGDI